ncbi:MAG TPA: TldD/PmbA family protein [Rhizobiales bacterium]|nr:TldD/PmbA family protein [Hyphomicrobiales bacterium]
MDNTLSEIADDLVSRAVAGGASDADVVAVNGQNTSVEARNGKLENTERSEGISVGLRVFVGKSQAIVTASRFTADDRAELVERAVAMARVAPQDPFAGLADDTQLAKDHPDLDICDTAEPSSEELLATALAAEAAGLAVKGVTQSVGGSASSQRNEIFLATSGGFRDGYTRTSYGVSAAMVAGEGTDMARDYDYSSAVHLDDLDGAADIGRNAGERAVKRLNPRKVASQKCPVIFDQRVASSLVGHFSSAVNGSTIARGTSFLKDDMGKALFADGVNIIDNARMKRGLASKPFDGEGVATGTRHIIENGKLASWLLDCRSARQLKLHSTGNAGRGTSAGPSPSSTNLYLEAGPASPDEMIADIKNGFYVTELIGMGVNTVTGDYSRGAAGFWIENGKISFSVSEVTIAGNLREMFSMLVPASDLEFHGSTNAPTCLITEMTLAGQ